MKKFAVVQFQQNGSYEFGTKEYTYLTDLELKTGDLVVVETSSNGFQVASVTKVRGIQPGQKSKATKWVVCKIDTTAHKERLRKQEIAQEIRNQLAEKREAIEEMMIYQHLAKTDPSIEGLLRELATVDEDVQLIEKK